jgi:hypothetical protein
MSMEVTLEKNWESGVIGPSVPRSGTVQKDPLWMRMHKSRRHLNTATKAPPFMVRTYRSSGGEMAGRNTPRPTVLAA